MADKRFTLSIIIPAYNEERHLKTCLKAIQQQTEKPDEVIVIDNNSTDKTAEIARSFPFVTLLREKRQGIAFARNKGFNASKSDLLGRIDADTILPRDWVAKRKAFYSPYRPVAWTGGGVYYNVRLPRLFKIIHRHLVFSLNRIVMGDSILWGSNMVLPRQLWQAVESKLCSRTDIHEDIDLAIHLHRLGYDVVHHAHELVGVKLRRVRSERQDLWANLQWWPRTLRVHKYKLWPLSWFFGAFLVYCASAVPKFMESIARLFGHKPLSE